VRVEVAEPPAGTDRLDELNVTVMLLGLAVEDRVTVPANRPILVTVIVLVAPVPGDELSVEGEALIVKSPTFTVIVTV
jgi:hypothetical protein